MANQETILLVDDDQEVASVLRDFLRQKGHLVVVAYTGQEGLRLLRETPIFLVLLDLRLPDIDGVTLMREAHRLDSPPEVVIITGHATLDSAIAAVEAGAAGYVLKPIDLTHLGALIDKVLERRLLIRENARLQAEQRQRAQEMEVLLSIAQMLGSTLELTPLLKEVAQKTAQAVGMERCAIFLWHEGRVKPVMAQFADGHAAPELWKAFKSMEGFAVDAIPAFAEAIRLAQPVVVQDVTASDLCPPWWITTFDLKSLLVVPLTRQDKAVGVLQLDNATERRRITDEQIDLAMTIAGQVALAVDNAKLYEQVDRERHRLETLYEVSRRLAAIHDTDQILSLIVNEATRLLRVEAAGLRLLEGTDLVLKARTESAAPFLSRLRLKVGESLSGLVVVQGEPVAVEDLGEESRYDPAHKRGALEHGFHGFLGVPLRVHGQVVGTLNVYTKDRRRFAADEIALLSAFADHAALAIDKARLYEEIQRQWGFLAQIFDTTSDGVMLVSREGRIEAANRSAGELLGFNPGEVLGGKLADLLAGHYAENERAVAALHSLLADPERGGEGDLEIPALKRILHCVAQPTKDDSPATTGFTLTVRDVTQELEVSQMKSDFVSFVTHQLRTPLAGIKWMLELAVQGAESPEETLSYIQDARSSAERLVALVNDLLDVSRLERGKLTVAPQETHLGELTRGVLDEVQPLIREKGHRLSVSGAEAIPAVLVDPQLFRQVILNLVSNAVKYTLPGGEVAICMSQEDALVRWAIQDSGIGIPKSAQRRLFEKFYRAENVLTIETEGTGLGLYLVRLIVEQFGGRVWCESEEGQGATFVVTLPISR